MPRKFPEIADQFKSAVQTHSQQKEIDTLRAEVEQLRAKHSPNLETELARLREQLTSQTGEMEVETDLIDPNPSQPRQTITDAEIQKKVRFLTQQGQTVPIILIPQENGRYLIFDGEVRWRAAKFKLGWEKIKAVLVPMPDDLHRSALETFLGFEDLNPLDKAEAVFRQVKQDTELDPAKAFTLLNTCLRAMERSGQIKELGKLVDASSEAQAAKLQSLEVTDDLALKLLLSILHMGLNPASVKTQLLPMLSLADDLKEAVRKRGLKGAHALILATLSAKVLKTNEKIAAKERIKATQMVLSQDLTVAKTRELVTDIKAKYAPSTAIESKKITSLIKTLGVVIAREELQFASPEQLVELRQKLTEALEVLNKP
ncbi:MAG: ParB N-terminal domain-containing protein [Trichocoleus desertorum ATA4-8-CV12]|jgi:ParB family chromosome partitioning protein|nr:ParB N-terminal domain-containing protein [Trichocoleus desertorum ATA4-8-CV12]